MTTFDSDTFDDTDEFLEEMVDSPEVCTISKIVNIY